MKPGAPALEHILDQIVGHGGRPPAFVLAGHNGSGKSTLWEQRLAHKLRMPLINADRLTLSILPPLDTTGQLPTWAQRLRDDDERWQRLSQEGVRAFKSLVMRDRMPFAFETVFSHWQPRADGSHASKADDIAEMQQAGYFVVLLFVGLVSVDLSILRVRTRRQQGGHAVAQDKLVERFARTQSAIGHAAPLADMAIMFDNSRSVRDAFTLARVQQKKEVIFDARDPSASVESSLLQVCGPWLEKVAGPR